jgi:hypothetical protein
VTELHARFTPLQRAPRSSRILALVAGPVLWLVGLAAVGLVVDAGAVQYGLEATAIAFVLSVPFCLLGRVRRVREERKAERA